MSDSQADPFLVHCPDTQTRRLLVLQRKESETLVLFLPTGETVNVTLSQVKGKAVKLAINAPEGVKVIREELIGPQA